MAATRLEETSGLWATENRARNDRSKLRYPSDLTDGEWAIFAPVIPAAKEGGNKQTVNLREIGKRCEQPTGLAYLF
jgi:hypothetical protein